ncbi:hypothetical protein HOE22_00105 [Candidatus Woesearchaeota archaeon]|jgi:hypothetical protein|nr:hypothetical protein [Candidatus Woesearchaeota archaeon]MBT4730500.1 hypothetical protein [Candidatus Woesearchaeota archaeon]MBT5760219.1 hypothetical protein [Candidatus Neomarinimicrobiota bacterium]MBT7555753.1 hypothetical protein [Candidatus Woesearchaeota archaeon]
MKKEKVSFTIDEDLIAWFRLHIKDEHTTMSALVNAYILNLKRDREGHSSPRNILLSSKL